ncbi:MAG: ATP-dependent helicase HrpB [Aquihabitans sp.]
MTVSGVAPTGLPVEDVVGEIRRALRGVGHAVLMAPPGAGKTTVVPLRLLNEAWLGDQRIVVLEPRRLAARAAARRMSELLGEPVGRTVGYRTRDEKVLTASSRIEVITEGILVRRLQRDPELPGTGLVILDEVHERNLTSDLSLAMLLDARGAIRPDLRVLAMSATLDATRLATLVGGDQGPAPQVHSDGRQYPVTVRWHPAHERDRLEGHTARVVTEALRTSSEGDVLVFLPGAAEIDRTAKALGQGLPNGVDVHRLHGSLPPADQDRALQASPAGRRRVVLATDIAESSLTVAGVRIVVDAGRARGPRFDAGSGLTRLVTVDASQASADQRAGRAGRLGPGVAHRLWSEAEHLRRPAFPTPEIAAADLTGLALELAAWGSDPGDLPFLDQPPARAWEEAVALLSELGALDDAGRPTPVGRSMSDLPVHPRLARLLVDGRRSGHGRTAAVLAALLDERDILTGYRNDRPADLAERVAVVDRKGELPGNVNRHVVRTVARRASELERRVGTAGRDGKGSDSPSRGRSGRDGPNGPTDRVGKSHGRHGGRAGGAKSESRADPTALGPLVALAYPERIAQATGGGRFRLHNGRGAELPTTDPLSAAPFLAVAELDAGIGDGRIRTAAALDATDVWSLLDDQMEVTTVLQWSPEIDDLRSRTETRAGALVLKSVEGRAKPGPDTVDALVDRVRATEGSALGWTDGSRALQRRIGFLRAVDGDRWPDVSDAALLADAETWLAPYLVGATGRRDLAALDLSTVLRSGFDHRMRTDLDRLAPTTVTLANGRTLKIDYADGSPTAAVRAQDLFGVTGHPTVVGDRVPVVLHILSPARRPVQVTADLPGFWAGTWTEVRKEMAGRYPKHDWPVDPATATPPAPRSRGGSSRR